MLAITPFGWNGLIQVVTITISDITMTFGKFLKHRNGAQTAQYYPLMALILISIVVTCYYVAAQFRIMLLVFSLYRKKCQTPFSYS